MPEERNRPARRKASRSTWPGFAESEAQPEVQAEAMQPSVDPRITPVQSGLEIHVLEGDDAGRTFPLDTWEIVLGRRMTPEEKKTGWILFNDQTVSRMHAVLEWRGGPRRYRVSHMSRTNPTLINGRLVQQAILYPEDLVRIGDVTFEVRLRTKNEVPEEQLRQEQERGIIYSGFKLVVADGPDQGRQFTLDRKVIHLGGPEAEKSTRNENWIILTDPNLPREQAFLVWYEADKKYGIFHAGTSPVPTQISRVSTTQRPSTEEARNLLQLDDMVILGETVLMVLKHELFMETGKSLRAGPFFQEPAGGRQPALEPPREPLPETPSAPSPTHTRGAPFHRDRLTDPDRPSPPEVFTDPDVGADLAAESSSEADRSVTPGERARARARELLQDWGQGRRVLEVSDKSDKRKRDEEPPKEIELSVRVKGGGLPPQLAGPHPSSLAERPHDATFNWFSRPDYILEVLEGPDQGRRIVLMSSGMKDGRRLNVGCAGRRVNDVELKDWQISNEQAYIEYRKGQFTFVSEAEGDVSINEIPLEHGERHDLKNGDEIRIARNVLLFIDHQALERQFQFELELVAHKSTLHKGRVFVLAQDSATIGRAKKANIRIDDPSVSRIHASVAFRRGGFVIEHKSDTNPTFINGVSLERDKERLLQPGDEIQLSDHSVLVFRQRQASELE